MAQIKLAEYTFDNSVSDCLPKFDNTLPSSPTYKISDTINGTVTTRIISVDDEALLPTRIHFSDDGYSAGRSIITCDYLNTSNCTSLYLLFYECGSYLTSVNMTGWDTSKVTDLTYAFYRNNQLTEIIGIEDIDTSSLVNASGIFNVTPKLTTLDLSKWDVSKVQVLSRAFSGCGATTINISTWNTCSVTTMDSMFDGCALTELDITHFDTSNVTNLNNMFANVKISSIDLSGWDVRKVQQTRLMFNSGSIKEINLDGWNTESLTDMWAMFCGSNITTVDINHFNVSKVTNASQLFDQCENLVSVDMSNLHFTSCQSIANMFSRCPKLTTVKMADFTGSPITAINGICYQSGALTEIDLTTVDVSRVTNMSNAFEWATSLKTLDLSTWDTRKATMTNAMFQGWNNTQTVYYEPPFWSIGTTTLNSNINWVVNITRNNGYWLDMTGITGATEITLFNENNLPTEEITTDWGDGTQNSELTHTYSTAGEYLVVSNLQLGQDNNKVNSYLTKATIYYLTKPYAMFYSCGKLTNVTLTDNWVELFNTFNETNGYTCDSMFYSCKGLSTLDTTQICKMKNITSMKNMFSGCSSLVELDLSGFDSTKVTSLQNTFSGCNALTSLNLDGLDLSSVTTMASMCNNCYSLTTFTPPKNNTNSLKILQDTFRNTRLLNYDFLNDWNLDQVTTFSSCLHSCAKMTSFSFKNKHLPSTTNLQYMFSGCTNLQTVDLSGLTVDENVGLLEMFKDCKSLTSANFSNSAIKPTTCANMFNGCSSLTSLDLSSLDTSQCTDMNSMFRNCTKLIEANLSSLNTSNITNMSYMFNTCSSLQRVNFDGWDTSSVTNLVELFAYCNNLEELDMSMFVTDKVTSGFRIINSCPNLKTLDISNISFTDGIFHMNINSLTTIGMVYCDADSINRVTSSISSISNKPSNITIYYYDADPSQLTPVEGVTFKKYQIPTTIQLPPHIQLHSLPDGTRDEVDIKTGILTRNVSCYDMIKVSEDGARTYYVLDEEFIEKVEPVIIDSESGSITMSEFLSGDGNISTNVDYITDDEGMITQAMFVANNHDKEDEYFIMKTTGNGNVLDTFTQATDCTVTYQEGNGFLVKSKAGVRNNVIRIENMNFEVGKTYNFKIELTTQTTNYQSVSNLRTVSSTSNIQYTNIFTNSSLNTDGTLILEGQYTHTQSNYTVLSMSFKVALNKDGGFLGGISPSYFVKVTVSEHSGNVPYLKLSYPNITLNKVLNCADELNLLTGEITRKVGVRPSKPTEKYTQLPLVEPSSYTTYKKEKLIAKLPTPTTEQLILNYNNSCDYGRILPTGMCDKYDVVNSMYTQTMASILLDGENTWDAMEEMTNVVKFTATGTTVGVENLNMLGAGGLYCDNDLFPNINDDSDVPHCRVDEAGNKFYIYVDKEMLMSPDLIGWQIWLQANKFNLIYELAEHLTYVKPYEELDPTQARWEGMDCMRDGAIKYHTNSSDNLTMYPTLEYVAPSINNFEVTMLEPNTEYTIYAEGINTNDTINLGGTDINFNNGTVYTSGDNQWLRIDNNDSFYNMVITKGDTTVEVVPYFEGMTSVENPKVQCRESTVSYTDLKLRSLPNGVKDTINVVTGEYIQRVGEREYQDGDLTNENVLTDGINTMYELENYIITKLDAQTLLAYEDGTINLSSDTGFLPTTHYTVPSTNTFHLPSMKTGTRYTLKYPSASGSITIGDINYSISSDSMLFTTPLKINGDTSAIIFSDGNPENVILLEGAYNKREVPFFTGVKSVKNPNITIIDQLSTESTTYNCETEIELRGLPNGVADKLDIIKGKLTTNVGIRAYQEGDENLPNIWTDGYETVYALSSPVVTNVTIDRPTVTTNSLIDLTSDYLIPQLNYRAPSSNNFPLDLLQPNTTYTLYADTLTSGSYILGGTRTGVYSQPHTITLGDMTDNLLTFNGDLGLSNVMLVKGNSLKTTLPPYFLGIRSVTDGHLLVEGMAGEMNELTFDEGIVLRDCNGVKDFIDLMTCTLTKRTGEITLTGAEGWYRADNESTADYNVFKLTLGGLKEALVMCDTLQSVFDTKMMDCIHAHTNELCIVIANATIGGNTVNALKSWLNQHPTTVVYQLRTPIEVQLENTWTTLPPTSYSNQTEISSTVSTNSLKPMISVTIATTTLEEIVSNLEAQNAQLEEENIATMLALTSVYETLATPSVATTEPQVATYGLRRSAEPIGMSVSPMGMVYAKLVSKGFKTIEEVPYNLQAEVMYALRGME